LVASPQDERRLVERRRIAYPPYDRLATTDATLADLDIAYVEQRAHGAPTVGGVLALSLNARRFFPGAYVQFIRFTGTDVLSVVTDHKELGGTLENVAIAAMDLLRLHIPIAIERPEDGGPDRRPPSYPLIALQELVVNAVMHRTYESNTPVRLSYFADRQFRDTA
jgi:ATP-dependent DNA helicase RecG